VSDETGLIATPLEVFNRKSKAQDFARIARLVRERRITAVVVGHPLNDDGSAGPQAQRIERYALSLTEALREDGLDLPLFLWDEWGSTQRAQKMMIGAGRKARHRRSQIDAAAAAVILQDFMDSEHVEPEREGTF
jgi:putative Holliday junction resolvase